jgi:alpha-L-fucosidase
MMQAGAALPLVGRRAFAFDAQSGAEHALARPTQQQTAWQDLEIGMFIHFGPNTWQEREYDDRSTPFGVMRPDINTEQWADCAAVLGAKYIVFVAKHTGGFCMWQTRTTEYSIRNLAWRGGRGDVMTELAKSCQKRGLKLGVYHSPRDDTFGAALGGKCKTPEAQKSYDAVYRQQLNELLSRYGEMVEIWFDASIVVPVGDILAKHAPRAMIFQGPHATIRWVGNEDGFAPYPAWNSIDRGDARTGIATAAHGDPLGDTWLPNEVDVSMRRPNWFWSTTNHQNLLSLDALMEIYYRSMGRGCQLLLNFTPDRRGLIPEADCARAAEFGEEIRKRFGKSVAETSGAAQALELKLRASQRVDHVVLQEDISQGERAREYTIEGAAGGKWISLGGGSAIGHKRIQPIEPRSYDALRLRVINSAGAPRIRRFAAFDTGAAPPATWNAPANVWAEDDIGRWRNSVLEADITKRIEAAGEFRLRCVPQVFAPLEIQELTLLVDGEAQADAVRSVAGRSDVRIVRIARAGQKVVLRGRVTGPPAGTVLLRKL